VLCRSSRLFFSLQQAFAEHEIPVEILGLAGLLRLPEIVEVLAYARAVSDPLASVALARILLGPRYRVGYKDLARVAALAKVKSHALRLQDEEEGEATPFLFAEALEHLDEVERLSDEARTRLDEFRWASSSARSCGGPGCSRSSMHTRIKRWRRPRGVTSRRSWIRSMRSNRSKAS
jgi:DNA helicase II / ATP-dependent DNA helicase PcrA